MKRFKPFCLWQPEAKWTRSTLQLALFTVFLSGCQPALNRQPKIPKPDRPSEFFADGRADRPIEAGTVARGQLRDDLPRFTGRNSPKADDYVTEIPIGIDEATLKRGQKRFNIYCSVCHDKAGTGNGKIVERGYNKPPSLLTDNSRGRKLLGKEIALRDVSAGYIFSVITNGYGAMPDYAEQIPADDRWAIIAFVRVLQSRSGAAHGE